jgi:NADH-quinone oxidoreductase subunit J
VFAAISAPDFFTFAAAAIAAVAGAIGVVTLRHPVHAALMLVMTFFAIAVLFVEQGAQFLAAVQVIVYAGAIVVLFLFVIMLLGVDKKETVFPKDSVSWKLPAGLVLSIAILVELSILAKGVWATGAHSVTAAPNGHSNVGVLARAVFTTYLLPFEATSVLLVIAVLGAVVLARISKTQEDISSESALEDEMGEVNAR